MAKTAAQARSNDLSNKLYRGEVSSAEEALKAVINGMSAEIQDTEQYNASLAPDEQEHRLGADVFSEYRDAARQALSIWYEEMHAAKERATARMRTLGENGELIANAIEADAWDGLAW